MLLRIHPETPKDNKIRQVVACLKSGGVIIYPTDTVYGLGCDITNGRAIEKICRMKGMRTDKANLSFICSDLSHISDYAKQIDNHLFKLMRDLLPGPYTFILEANNNVPKLLKTRKKTVGIRVPDNRIAHAIVKELGHPIVSTSLHVEDSIMEYPSDPELIWKDYGGQVDLVIDGGPGGLVPSTVLDCTDGVTLVRQGKGPVDTFLVFG